MRLLNDMNDGSACRLIRAGVGDNVLAVRCPPDDCDPSHGQTAVRAFNNFHVYYLPLRFVVIVVIQLACAPANIAVHMTFCAAIAARLFAVAGVLLGPLTHRANDFSFSKTLRTLFHNRPSFLYCSGSTGRAAEGDNWITASDNLKEHTGIIGADDLDLVAP